MTNAPDSPEAPATLSPEQEQAIISARRRAGKVRRAVAVARFDAWCTAFFAATTLMLGMALGFSAVAILIGVGMTAVAYNSFRGVGELKQFQTRGAYRLGWNQIAFLGIITVYCIVNIAQALLYSDKFVEPVVEYVTQMQSLTNQSTNPEDMSFQIKALLVVFFGAVIFASGLVQGLTALYYFTRAKHVRAFTEKTPSWVVELLRAAG